MSAKEEVANIEAHIRMFLPESYLESIGANVQAPNHTRELHHRCMRIFSDLSDRLAGADALRDVKAIAEAVHYYTGEDVDALVQRYRDEHAPTEPTR